MTRANDLILVLVLLMNFVVLGTSRMRVCIQAASFQGLLISILPLVIGSELSWHTAVLALGAAALKGALIPSLLFKAIRDVQARREVEPYVGFVPSLLLCAAGTALAVLYGGSLPLAPEHQGTLVVPTALATLLSGFLVLTTRRKAISQVVGYLILENGIFIFGLLLLDAMPFMVEGGVLLDLFVGIFIMGIVLNDIQKEFSSIDTDELSQLKE
jgi:hydrogenase-4 component E